MEKRDLHVHTMFSDGNDRPETLIEAALKLGYTAIGFADHSPTSFDMSWCMPHAVLSSYRLLCSELKEKYRDRIEVLCGIEQDYYADDPAKGYDFVIGSVHYVLADGEYCPVDDGSEYLKRAADAHFGGDVYALCEAYFATVADVVSKTGATIIGHFDLVAKYNERDPLFDESHPRYVAAWQKAADALLATGVPFERNFGAVTRGIRSVPYPAPAIEKYLLARGASLLDASDAHSVEQFNKSFPARG